MVLKLLAATASTGLYLSCTCLTLYSINTHFDASTTGSFLTTLWEKKKLLVTSNFSFPTMFSTQSDNCTHLSIFLTSYFYLLLNWMSQKLALYEVKGY